MARVVEESSDEEFPKLTDMVRNVKAGTGRLNRGVAGDAGNGISLKNREGEPEKGKLIEKKKKRVLNQASENPLLRPFESKSSSREGSEALGDKLRVEVRSLKSGLSKQTALEKHSRAKIKVSKQGRSDSDAKDENAGKKPRRRAAEKKPPPVEPSSESEEEISTFNDSDHLSDFIVDDASILEEEDSILEPPPPPPRSTRKLVRGRKPTQTLDSHSDSDLESRLRKLSVKDEVSEKKDICEKPVTESIGSKNRILESWRDSSKQPSGKQTSQDGAQDSNSELEDPFTLRYSPSQNSPKKVSKETRFVTPPSSPSLKPKGLVSPSKKQTFIPKTPHRQSMDSFWQQDVINDWNDEYSPRKKMPRPYLKSRPTELDSSIDSELLTSPKKSPMKQDKAAKDAKKAFSQKKHALAQEFLDELDKTITDCQISKLAAGTGGVKIIWSKKLNTTAGRANWKRETIRSTIRLDNGNIGPPTFRHHASIELAEKVIDDEDRLLNVIAHEFCHLANFMVSNIKTNPHGKEFKAWAARCSRHFGHRGIEVTTKHSYTIDYKYVWECVACGLEFKRHSKSIDPTRHQCGSCKSKLIQTKPVPRTGTAGMKVSQYQLFVKENMKKVREENPGSPQKEIMGLVGKRYQEYKNSRLVEKSMESIDIKEVNPGSKESTPDTIGEEVEFVARKLDFFDLTSP